MNRSASDLQAVRAATRRLLHTIDPLTDAQAHEPSRLPGWNRAQVLTHIARNADGVRNMVEHATRGEVGDQYPGGVEQRSREINSGIDAARRRRFSTTCDTPRMR